MPPSLSIAKAVLSCSTWTSALQSIQTLERLIGPGKIPIEAHVHSLHLLLRQQQQQQRSMSASCFDEYMEKLNSAKYESLLPHSPLLVSKPNQGLLENNAHSNNINNNNNEAKDSVQTTLNHPHSHQHHLPSLLLLRALIPHLQRQRLDLAFETLFRWNLLSLHPVKEGDDHVDSSSSLSSTTSSSSSCSFATLIDEVDFPYGLPPPLAEPYCGVMQWLLNSTIREWEHEHVVAQQVAARRHRLRHQTAATATSSSPSTAAAAAQELSTTDEPHTTLQANLDELTKRAEHLLTLIARFAPHHERVSELTHRLLHVVMQQMQRPLSTATLFYVACRLRKAAAAAVAVSASDSLRSTADYALWIVLRRATPSFDVAFSTMQQIALQSSVSFSASTSSCCRMAPEHLELLLDRLESTGSGNHVELSAFAELVEAMMTSAADHVVSPALLRRVLVACRDWRRSVNDTPMEMMWIKGHLVALWWWRWRSCQNHGASLLDGMWAAHCCFPTAREKAVVYVSALSLLSSEGDVDPLQQQQQSKVVSVVQQWLLGAKGSQWNDDNGSLSLPAATTTTLHDLVLESLHVVKDRLSLVPSSSSSSKSWDVSQLISTLVARHLLWMRDEPETDTLSTAAWLRTLTAAIQSEQVQQKSKPQQQQRQQVLTRLLLQMRLLLEQQQQSDASVMPQQQQPKRERVELMLSLLLAQCVESLSRTATASEERKKSNDSSSPPPHHEDIRDALHQFVTAPCVASFLFGPDSLLLDVTCGLLCTDEGEGEDRLLKAYARVLRSRTTEPDHHHHHHLLRQELPPLLCPDAFIQHLHITKESFLTRVSQLPSASHRQTLLELRSRWLVVCTTHLLQSPSVTLHTKVRCLLAMQQLQGQHALSNESFLLQSQQRWQSWLLAQLKDRSITVSAEVAVVGMELARAALQAQPLFSKQLTEIMFRERGWVASDAFMKDVVGSIAGSAQQKKKR